MESSEPGMAERLSLIVSEKALANVGARVEDLTDPEVRAAAIRADHPELDRALRDGKDEVIVDGDPISIRLHLTMHEVLANQLADDDPPEVYTTAQRLLAAGYERHEVLHLLAAPIAEQIHATLAGGEGYDRDRHLTALAVLPGTWERRRTPTNPETRGPTRTAHRSAPPPVSKVREVPQGKGAQQIRTSDLQALHSRPSQLDSVGTVADCWIVGRIQKSRRSETTAGPRPKRLCAAAHNRNYALRLVMCCQRLGRRFFPAQLKITGRATAHNRTRARRCVRRRLARYAGPVVPVNNDRGDRSTCSQSP